jgi:hypothetical protein
MNEVAGSAFSKAAIPGKANHLGLGELSMRRITRSLSGLGLILFGYVLGSSQSGHPSILRAEPQAESQSESLPTAISARLRETDRALSDTMQVLADEKRYVPAIQGLNAFATSAGGVDAIADLESGQGVDPETFAGLYAGRALAEVAEHLGRDAEGHMTYKNKVVRMYSPTRLRSLFAARAEFVPAAATTSSKRPADSKKETEAAPEKSKDE